jgi:hypothetical protein
VISQYYGFDGRVSVSVGIQILSQWSMDNCTNNTNCSTPDVPQLGLAGPGFGAFVIIVLLFVVVSVVLNVFVIVSLYLAHPVAKILKIFLINLLVAGLFSAAIVIYYSLISIVLNFSSLPPPDLWLCRIAAFGNVMGTVTRLWSLAAFSMIVLLTVRYGSKRVFNPVYVVLSLVSIWTAGVILSVHILIPPFFATDYLDNVVCIALTDDSGTIVEAKSFFTAVEITIGGIIPLIITAIVPIVIFCFLKCKKLVDWSSYLKGLAKLIVFLLVGNGLGFISQILIGVLVHLLSLATVYLLFLKATIALFPPPLLIIAYLRPVRKQVFSVLCYPCHRHRSHKLQLSSRSTETPLVIHNHHIT